MGRRNHRAQRAASADPESFSPANQPTPFKVGSIFSDSLRRALSPNPLPPASSASMSQQFYPVAIDNVSSEEIWSPGDENSTSIAQNDYASETGGLLGASRRQNLKPLQAQNFDEEEEYDDFGDEQAFHVAQEKEFARQKRWLMFWGITLVVLILGTTITLGVLLSKKPETVKHGRGVPGNGTYPTVIMISLDGFRSDYLDRGLSPSLSKLAHDGVRAEYLRPSFPSITFPNHYTLVTGLYPESHGIVANVFFDPRLNDTFVYVDSEKNGQSKWWGGEPLWVTAIKQGRISATCMWPGSEAPIQNIRPNYWLKYDGKMTLTARADQILKWLDLPHNERPSFMTLYASDVDLAGHNFGPNSKAVNDSIVNVDRMVGRIVKGLEKRNLTDSVNVIIVSDHGMTEANNNWIFLDDFVSYDSITIVNNLIISIYPKNMNELETIYATLKNASLKSGNWDIWKREEVPEYLHYSNNLRIAPLVAMPRKNYGISLRKEFDPEHNARGGLHGYNNSDVDMQAIFVAAGPAFRPTLLPMFVNQTLIDFHGNSSNVFNASSVKPSLSHEALAGSEGGGGHKKLSTRSFANIQRRQGEFETYKEVVEVADAPQPEAAAPSQPSPVSEEALNEAVKLRMLPAFDNVNVYNLVSHVLKIKAAPNNGSAATIEALRPWLRY